jgi:hypothetical protein
MYALKCPIIQSNPTYPLNHRRGSKDHGIMYTLKHRNTYLGVQKPLVRSGIDPLCQKVSILAFVDKKDVVSFLSFCRWLQKKNIALNTGYIENDALQWHPMKEGDKWMSLEVASLPFAEMENNCMVNYLDLMILQNVQCRLTDWSAQGIEITYDLPPKTIAARILNRLYHT